jgi:hypothetical protein
MEIISDSGGAIGLTENPSALTRWVITGPEIAWLVDEFEARESGDAVNPHHEQTPAAQQRFRKEVCSLESTFEEMGNPYNEDTDELLTLDTKVCCFQLKKYYEK